MYLSDVYTQLSSGELSQLAEGEGLAVTTEAMPKINALILAGLNDLNKHFSIKEKELLVTTKIGKTRYELVPENAVSSGNPYAFIQDSVEDPFVGDIVQILAITDMDGISLWGHPNLSGVNLDEGVYGSHYKPAINSEIILQAYNTFKLKDGIEYGDLLVKYKAKIKSFDPTLNPEEVVLDLPDHFMNALVLYVASRKYNPMGAETIGRGMFHEGNNYWSKYQEEVLTLKATLANFGTMGENTNFLKGGWV